MTRRVVALALLLAPPVVSACKKPKPEDAPPPEPVTIASHEVVPPAAPFNATPLAEFADAGNIDGKPPFEQAKIYYAQGQLWMGRLVLEPKALGGDGTKEEAELLAKICQDQQDAPCVDACSKRLGRKLKMPDGGAPVPSKPLPEHKEPDTELARARDLVLNAQPEPARKMLEPKVLDGKASREEIRLLKMICVSQKDRMCIALCDAKLK
jgi:hypothetical protein